MDEELDQINLPTTQDDARASRMNELLARRKASHGRFQDAANASLRMRGQLIQEEVSKQNFALRQQQLELERLKQLTDITSKTAAIRQQITEQTHVQNAFTALGDADPLDPGYTKKMATVFAENPMATKDPTLQVLVRNQVDAMQAATKSKQSLADLEAHESTIDQHASQRAFDTEDSRQAARYTWLGEKGTDPKNPSADMNAAIAGGKVLKAGKYDAATKEFTGTSEEDATHVNMDLQNPKTGDYENHNIPIDAYRAAVAAGKQGAPPVAAPADPAAPKLNPLPDDVATTARAAITSGKDPDAVKARLQQNGFDTSGF